MRKQSRAAEAVIERGTIVIRLPIRNLASAVRYRPEPLGVKVTNAKLFAQDVVRELNKDDEAGACAIHRLFDIACEEAVDNGSLGVTPELVVSDPR